MRDPRSAYRPPLLTEHSDLYGWSVTLRCPRCQWKFRVPVEQVSERTFCRACESDLAALLQ